MYLLAFIVANCVLTVFNKDNDDDDDTYFCPYLRQLLTDFQNFCHRNILWKICNKLVIEYTTTP